MLSYYSIRCSKNSTPSQTYKSARVYTVCTRFLYRVKTASRRGKLRNHHGWHCLLMVTEFSENPSILFGLTKHQALPPGASKICLPSVNYLHSTCHMRPCYWRPGKGLVKRPNASCAVPRAQKEREVYQLTKGNSPGTKEPLGNRPQTGQWIWDHLCSGTLKNRISVAAVCVQDAESLS